MDFVYALNKNLTEAASYKLIRSSERLLVFSNGSVLGWLFFLAGVAISSVLLYSGFITRLSLQKELAACVLFIGASAFFTVLGFIAGIGTSKLIIDPSSKTYAKKDLSLKGIAGINGPLTDFSGISLELKILRIRGGEYPVYLAKLLSDKFKKDLIIGISRSRSKIYDLSELLTRQLGIPIIERSAEP